MNENMMFVGIAFAIAIGVIGVNYNINKADIEKAKAGLQECKFEMNGAVITAWQKDCSMHQEVIIKDMSH